MVEARGDLDRLALGGAAVAGFDDSVADRGWQRAGRETPTTSAAGRAMWRESGRAVGGGDRGTSAGTSPGSTSLSNRCTKQSYGRKLVTA
jgi:hypothetical protein